MRKRSLMDAIAKPDSAHTRIVSFSEKWDERISFRTAVCCTVACAVRMLALNPCLPSQLS